MPRLYSTIGKNLIRRRRLHIGVEGEAVIQKVLGVQLPRAGVFGKRDKGYSDIAEMMRLCGKGCIFRSADQNFLEWENRDLVQRFADFHRACDDSRSRPDRFRAPDGLRRRVVGDAQADVRIAGVEVLQAESSIRRSAVSLAPPDKAAQETAQEPAPPQPCGAVQATAHAHTPFSPSAVSVTPWWERIKSFAAKLTFQIVHAPCDVGLVVFQNFRGFCKAVILCYEVKMR